MESLITLLRIFLFTYLGFFTYISYQIIFYFHKRFLVIKTFSFFFVLSLLIIKISNKYDVIFFVGYLFFYMIGIYTSRIFLKTKIHQNAKLVKHFLIIPFKKQLIKFIKIIVYYNSLNKLKNYIKSQIYYRKHPYKRPKTIYELF